jgi:hypothetical protein
MNIEEWINEYFKENWKEIDTDINFSEYEPISKNSSLHINEERYEISGKTYRVLYPIGYKAKPTIQVLL